MSYLDSVVLHHYTIKINCSV